MAIRLYRRSANAAPGSSRIKSLIAPSTCRYGPADAVIRAPPNRYRRAPGRPSTGDPRQRDFACNLYWQSVSLFLLFFYTDVLRLAPAIAGSLYMIGALWDGLADLTVGIVLQRRAVAYRRVVAWGAAPLVGVVNTITPYADGWWHPGCTCTPNRFVM